MFDLSARRWHERMIRVLVVNESPLFRRALIVALEAHLDLEVVAEASEASAAVRRAAELTPDIAFAAIRLPGGGARIALSLRETVPGIEVAVLTVPDDGPDAVRAIRAGARGFVPRDSAVAQGAEVARALVAGRPVLPPNVAAAVLTEFGRLGREATSVQRSLAPPTLDPREAQVLQGLAERRSIGLLAADLDLRPTTVANLARNAIDKLHRHARSEGVLFAAGSA